MNIGDCIQKFIHERFKIEKNIVCRMCANTVSFQNGAWDGHKCSGFQPFLSWIFPRGDTSIFSKNVVKFCRTKWGVVKGLKSTRYVGFVSERYRLKNFGLGPSDREFASHSPSEISGQPR